MSKAAHSALWAAFDIDGEQQLEKHGDQDDDFKPDALAARIGIQQRAPMLVMISQDI